MLALTNHPSELQFREGVDAAEVGQAELSVGVCKNTSAYATAIRDLDILEIEAI